MALADVGDGVEGVGLLLWGIRPGIGLAHVRVYSGGDGEEGEEPDGGECGTHCDDWWVGWDEVMGSELVVGRRDEVEEGGYVGER